MRNLINFAVLIMTIFIVSASGARETRMMEQTCPVFWPMVPCDANKCEQMCRDYYGSVPSYCNRIGTPIAECACSLTPC
ncbi:hypothetical protein ISN45_At01g014930 [Arabidopsis thaliana x Arabidopsis arenosa]|uniref:Defensin-like protein 201 n=4 Tax=Arabidopsis TaxID=3701 RepID=DF201_ARATH|nr:S locus-related glycoprotein 1 (SLR1) binding pollen coat protein family [Arabidopsis thaliana]Q2V4N2.1 RecName: Full=Defensin-like protein 201; Flags: Precursor [Arabidopsis thaliana]KAG7646344.1 hypothetical protein ISN45_At01g014930 [Arabidopsis thaliana x Arabidopsis arenosa]ABI34010.1 unknown [Arabidopsis thaliana]AEE29219.1 S locus-related glycoprotein 1 (SLR1) binding pollen coat protein family [Arabidopsis thaliana]OAP14876.1 hypothetical protein AXX17_AT1G15430 [Arabidopsis thalian|eukprot:NP_001031047.1 S locus-related glycoprotein 1 (SLR1) binding pollen coat protein family [Arabidopsis thaliana]